MIKIVYAYDPNTKEFLGTAHCRLCPVTQSDWIIPARTTDCSFFFLQEPLALPSDFELLVPAYRYNQPFLPRNPADIPVHLFQYGSKSEIGHARV